jgi:hypothetical protein
MQQLKGQWVRIALLVLVAGCALTVLVNFGDRAPSSPDRNVPGATTGPGKSSLHPDK